MNEQATALAAKMELKAEIANLGPRLARKTVGLFSLFTIIVKWL